MILKELNVLYINNPISFSNEIDALLEKIFNRYFDITTFEDSVTIFRDEFIDLMLIDIDYTEANGLKFLQVIKQKAPDFPVILFSKADIKEVKELIGDIRANAIIRTPYDPSELAEKIETIKDDIIAFADKREDRKKEPVGSTLGVAEAIDMFFKHFNDELRKAQKGRPDKKMDFAIMKTFLYTAYNNFNDFDPKFDDNDLKLAKRNLEKAMKIKRDVERKLASSLEDNYELIFLNQQAEYLQLKRQFDEAKSKIQKYRDSLALLGRQIEEHKEELKTLKKDDEAYLPLSNSLKEINKKHVDRVHYIAELKTKIDSLDEEIDAYKARYFDEFKSVFSGKTDTIKEEIKETLNYAAYAFDREIWRRAKQSRPVRDFFHDSKITGLFSSKTYLEYFSGNIDDAITSEQNKKILNYLNELNRTNKINIALIGSNADDIGFQKMIIEKIDKSIKVIGFLDPQKALGQHKHMKFDLVVVDEQVGNLTANQIIQQFKDRYRENILYTEFCINLESKKKTKTYNDAVNAGVHFFIDKQMRSDELTKKMLEIL